MRSTGNLNYLDNNNFFPLVLLQIFLRSLSNMDSEEFLLLPLNLPDDSHEILRLHYQNYLSDPFYTSSLDTLQTENEFINSRLKSISEQFSKVGVLAGKLVLRDQPEKMAGYIV